MYEFIESYRKYERQRERAAEAFERALIYVQEELCKDPEWVCEFIAESNEREPSAYFGSISVQEMVTLMVGGQATPEQLVAIASELRERFISYTTSEAERRALREIEG